MTSTRDKRSSSSSGARGRKPRTTGVRASAEGGSNRTRKPRKPSAPAPQAAPKPRAPQARPELDGRQRRQLRALAHELKPIVNVGHQGVTDGVVASVDQALLDHELIKVKINPNNEDDLATLAEALGKGAHAAVVQQIGRIVVLFRPHPDEPRIALVR